MAPWEIGYPLRLGSLAPYLPLPLALLGQPGSSWVARWPHWSVFGHPRPKGAPWSRGPSHLEDAKEGKKDIEQDPTGLLFSHPSHQQLHQKENKIAGGDTLGFFFGMVQQYGKKCLAYLKSWRSKKENNQIAVWTKTTRNNLHHITVPTNT